MADPKFSRPAVYDPALIAQERPAALSASSSAAAAAAGGKQGPAATVSAKKKLDKDLGIDDLDQDLQLDDADSREDAQSPVGGALDTSAAAAPVDLDLYVPIAEHDRIIELFKGATRERVEAEHKARKAAEELDRVSDFQRKAQAILVHRHKAAVKALRAEIAEKKQLLEDDEQQIMTLKKQLADLETAVPDDDEDGASPTTAEDAESRTERKERQVVSDFQDLRKLQLQVVDLSAKVAELNEGETARQLEVQEYKRAYEDLQARFVALEASKGSAGDVKVLLDMQQQIDRLTLEKTARRAAAAAAAADTSSSAAAAAGGPGKAAEDLVAASLAKELAELRRAKADHDSALDKLRARNAQLEASLAAANAAGAATADTSSGLADAEAKIKQLTTELLHTTNSLATLKTASASGQSGLTAELDQVKRANAALSESSAQREEAVRKATELVRKREEQLKLLKDNAQTKLKEASEHIKKLKAEYANLREAYQSLKVQSEENARKMHAQMIRQRAQSIAQRKTVLEAMAGAVASLRAELRQLRSQVTDMDVGTDAVTMQIVTAVKRSSLANVDLIKTLRENYERELRLRKKVFNQLQELRGNIRVYARVRPLGDRESGDKRNYEVMQFLRDGELRVENAPKKQVYNFEFERVFKPDSKQEDVFEECQDLVTSVLDGYNVCMFAYGQTGSGKTFTMEGPRDNPGVNTRALDKLFAEAQSKAKEWQYQLRLTLLEIYNEKVQDLLSDSSDNLKVVSGAQGMEVLGLTHVDVQSAADVQKWLTRGKKNRHITKTDMNDHSSRSHLILSVYVAGKNIMTGVSSFGKLHLIDLAGSERISRSNVTGEALKEAQKINYSLSALGNVISARANKAEHVPYRNSMLTYLLQDSLEKNSKTLMFVQLSPTLDSVTETLCSLRFAERVRKVELGKAGRNVAGGSSSAAAAAGPPRDEAKADEDYPEPEDDAQ